MSVGRVSRLDPSSDLSECSLLAGNTTDFTFKMRHNISVAKQMSEARSSLASWKAAKMGCQSSCTRSKTQAEGEPEQNPQHEVQYII